MMNYKGEGLWLGILLLLFWMDFANSTPYFSIIILLSKRDVYDALRLHSI